MKKRILAVAVLIVIFFSFWLFSPLQFNADSQWIFYDRNGEILFSEKPYFQLSQPEEFEKIKKVLIAVEDHRFYDHWGVDLVALVRATKDNFSQQKTVSGASTITMQLARMLFLEKEEHDLWYKVRQIFYAWKLEVHYSKEEILQMYLDRVYLGQGSNGFSSAANRYFSKPVGALALPEVALLVGIIPRPDTWNPIRDKEQAENRKNLVLNRLGKGGILTESEQEFYSKERVALNVTNENPIHAPHFVLWVKKQLEYLVSFQTRHWTISPSQVHVYTTLDKSLYQQVLFTIRGTLDQSLKNKNLSNMSVVSADLRTNELLLMLGGSDFFDKGRDGEVNMTTSSRELGSTLKPFLFAYALEHGFTPLDTLEDEEQSFLTSQGSYTPKNFDPHKEYGQVRFREALVGSYNIAAVYLLEKIGLKNFHDFLGKLRLTVHQDPEQVGLSLILGTGESSLLSLTNAYTIFPRKGQYETFQFFTKIEDERGNPLLDFDSNKLEIKNYKLGMENVGTPYMVSKNAREKSFMAHSQQMIANSTAEWITHTLSDQESRWNIFSRGNPLEFEYNVAAKTGTSQDFRDNYVVGYSSNYITGVWAGNTDGTPMYTSSGIEGTGPLWHRVMRMLHGVYPRDFQYESNRQETLICRKPWEGYSDCSEVMTEFLLPEDKKSEFELASSRKHKPKPEMAFPSDGDRFHRDSPILIKVRNVGAEDVVHYFVDGVEREAIIPKLSVGGHVLEIEVNGESDRVEISVEE